jgi:hypothetical protein
MRDQDEVAKYGIAPKSSVGLFSLTSGDSSPQLTYSYLKLSTGFLVAAFHD